MKNLKESIIEKIKEHRQHHRMIKNYHRHYKIHKKFHHRYNHHENNGPLSSIDNKMEKIIEAHHKGHHHHHYAGLSHKEREEFYLFHKYMIYFKFVALIVSIIVTALMFISIGIQAITIFFAVFFAINEIANIYIYYRLERKIVKPIEKLREGVEKISTGDYSVRVENNSFNEIGILTRAFNDMASKLEEGEKLKIEYEENRKNLIANISHDLKTPITSINGYIEFIVDGKIESKEKVNGYLKTIQSNIGYMNRLIDDLFLFSQLDVQKLDFSFNKTNMRMYMIDVIEEFTFILGEENIGFKYIDNLKEDLFVNIDGKRIYRTIRNIIGNAIKYGTTENLSIGVTLYNSNDFIFIDIMDNGPGIEKEHLKHVFERFYRIDKERTKDLLSTGLGLAIAKEIVEAHGGDITVESELNEGTTFTISLPLYSKESIDSCKED
ncbi:MAG: HAMP domain-containing sensor histidine kinase [Clostridium perfringens]|nr:HAMP domain-containing sensor histidine kinase [Clostridium perfringens]